jgi:hypothetical protein
MRWFVSLGAKGERIVDDGVAVASVTTGGVITRVEYTQR